MYVIELALKLSPLTLSVQRKKLVDAQTLYNQIRECLEKGHTKLLELTCEQMLDKKIAVLSSEIISIQIYEKSSAHGGNKRPGFSF